MLIILDFDYTLFDTARFKDALVAVVEKCGPTREEVLRSYSDVVNRPGCGYDYDPDLQLELLASRLTCPLHEVRAALDAVAARAAAFVYPGAADFLDALRSRGHRLVLLTLGNDSWQRLKVRHSGLAERFDTYETTLQDKAAALRRIAAAGEAVVVNDNGREVAAMRRSVPGLAYIIKRGPKPLPDDPSIPVCDTYGEILEVIDGLAAAQMR